MNNLLRGKKRKGTEVGDASVVYPLSFIDLGKARKSMAWEQQERKMVLFSVGKWQLLLIVTDRKY